MPVQETAETPIEFSLDDLSSTPEGREILSCMQCGTCVGTCPYGEYMEYPVRKIIKMAQKGLLNEVINSGSALKCVLCYACMEKCPRGIRLGEFLLPFVKEQTLTHLPQIPSELKKMLENTWRYGNPMGDSPRKRVNWIQNCEIPIPIMAETDKSVEVLWFVECYYSYYPRGQDTCRSLAKIFQALGVEFAILGNEEKCAGECGRKTWETGLFDTLMDYNMEIFRKYRHQFQRIITSDPHAYTAFRGRYQVIGGFNYNLEHTIPFLARHIDKLKPVLTRKLNYKVTYHDSCCLGRHFGHYEEPRALLEAIPGVKVVEMIHNRSNAICCGGGGGGMWLDTYYKSKGMERLSDRRVKEAIATGADVLAIACPYEIFRFEDSLKVLGYDKKMVVRDITELVAESLGDNKNGL